MNRSSTLFAVCFSAGAIGALATSLTIWLFGVWGVTTSAGVAISPDLTAEWLYPRLVWGGLWGLVYFLSVGSRSSRRHWVRKGLWISLLPSIFQLAYIFPEQTPHGFLGLELGQLTPFFVVGFNLVWGFFTGLFTRIFWGR